MTSGVFMLVIIEIMSTVLLLIMVTHLIFHNMSKQEHIQSSANHPLAKGMGYIKFEGM